jgi:hypothetical protein
MQRLMSITIRGKHHEWSFEFDGDTKHLDEWRADGLDICTVENIIPEWVVNLGLLRPWCFFQDLINLNFKSLFGK